MKNLVVTLFALSVFGFAFAQFQPPSIPANVDFTGTVASACTVNGITPGILEVSGGFNLISTTPGEIDVSCTTGVTVDIIGVEQLIGDLTSNSAIARVETSAGTAEHETTPMGLFETPITVSGPVSEVFIVSMDVDNIGFPIPGGDYAFQVHIDLIPN